jgi:hypothetical protein
MVAHTCNPSTWEAEVGDCDFEASLDYRMRLCLKKRKGKLIRRFYVFVSSFKTNRYFWVLAVLGFGLRASQLQGRPLPPALFCVESFRDGGL